MKKVIYFLAASFLAYFPLMASAQSSKVENPLSSENVTAFLGEVIKSVTTLAIPVIVVFIIYSGFLFVTSGGSEGKLETAKKTAINTLIGAAIILAARFLADILINTAESLGVENLT